jgi:hypothetical protein
MVTALATAEASTPTTLQWRAASLALAVTKVELLCAAAAAVSGALVP